MLVATLLTLLVGAALGIFGGGGSILMLPILKYVAGVDAREAVAMSLLVVLLTSGFAILPYARRKAVRFRMGLLFGAAGMVGAYTAGRLAGYVPGEVLLVGFALMMLATAFAMLRPKRSAHCSETEGTSKTAMPVLKILIEGLVVGAVTGLVGAGGGFLVVPALVILGRLPMQEAVGTSLLVIAMKSLAALTGFLAHTSIDWGVSLGLGVAAIVGSMFGTVLATRVSANTLRIGFGWFVVTMACFVLVQELPAVL